MKPSQTIESTSGAGPFRRRSVENPIIVGFILVGLGTSACDNLAGNQEDLSRWLAGGTARTSSGTPSVGIAAEDAIAELRQLSGFTWEQLARLLGVTRRAVHFWASGKPMTASHEEKLHRVLGVVRRIDRGSTPINRSLLLAVGDDGTRAFDLLQDGAYEDVVVQLGVGPSSTNRAAPVVLSERARAMRKPPAPAELVEALQDPIHREQGPARAARAVRIRTTG